MFKNISEKIKRWNTARKINKGLVPRGRANLNMINEQGGDGSMGDAAVFGETLLNVKHIRNGEVIGTREVKNRCVTNAGRDAIVDAFTGTFTLSNFNYHDCGTGTTSENVSDTALVSPVTEARVSGTQSQPTSDTYRSVATITFSNSYAITEHGLFSQSSKPGGVLLDRTVFSAINVQAGDSIQFTFDISFSSGG